MDSAVLVSDLLGRIRASLPPNTELGDAEGTRRFLSFYALSPDAMLRWAQVADEVASELARQFSAKRNELHGAQYRLHCHIEPGEPAMAVVTAVFV